jgi:hypothetical protein
MENPRGLDDVRARPSETNITETPGLERSKQGLQQARGGRVIHLKDRKFSMLRKDLIFRNPLRLMGGENEEILPEGGLGAVLARAGVGKTALLVQLALDSLLRSRNVMHISLNDPVSKVCLWYEEVFRVIARQYDVGQMDQLWEAILPHRFIMTFKVGGFSAPKLDERLTDLTEQGIFLPQMILIDGLPFDEDVRGTLLDLKTLAENYGVHVWFAVRTHRHQEPAPDGTPVPLVGVTDLFEAAIQLQPEGKEIHLRILKGKTPARQPLMLDPETMLISDKK